MSLNIEKKTYANESTLEIHWLDQAFLAGFLDLVLWIYISKIIFLNLRKNKSKWQTLDSLEVKYKPYTFVCDLCKSSTPSNRYSMWMSCKIAVHKTETLSKMAEPNLKWLPSVDHEKSLDSLSEGWKMQLQEKKRIFDDIFFSSRDGNFSSWTYSTKSMRWTVWSQLALDVRSNHAQSTNNSMLQLQIQEDLLFWID